MPLISPATTSSFCVAGTSPSNLVSIPNRSWTGQCLKEAISFCTLHSDPELLRNLLSRGHVGQGGQTWVTGLRGHPLHGYWPPKPTVSFASVIFAVNLATWIRSSAASNCSYIVWYICFSYDIDASCCLQCARQHGVWVSFLTPRLHNKTLKEEV